MSLLSLVVALVVVGLLLWVVAQIPMDPTVRRILQVVVVVVLVLWLLQTFGLLGGTPIRLR
jgi:hypothetical protein